MGGENIVVKSEMRFSTAGWLVNSVELSRGILGYVTEKLSQ